MWAPGDQADAVRQTIDVDDAIGGVDGEDGTFELQGVPPLGQQAREDLVEGAVPPWPGWRSYSIDGVLELQGRGAVTWGLPLGALRHRSRLSHPTLHQQPALRVRSP